MLRNAREIMGYRIVAPGGEIGTVFRLSFDDETWTVRYLSVRGTGELGGRHILISPIALGGIDDNGRVMQVTQPRELVARGPSLEAGAPITAEYEREFYRYYGWPVYWSHESRWGSGTYPSELLFMKAVETPERRADPGLRDTDELSFYRVIAEGGELGPIFDYVVDDRSWAMRYFIVPVPAEWGARKVLISPHWIERMNASRREAVINIRREMVKNAPAFDPRGPVSREYEEQLFRYYGREGDIDAARPRQKLMPTR